MNNLQETLLFPVRDAESRKQFLIACGLTLAIFVIPILPVLFLMGYSAKIMRQVVEEKRAPSMPAWQGSDWSEMLMDGLRIYGAQLILTLPLMLLMGCGILFMLGGSIGMTALADDSSSSLALIGTLAMTAGFVFVMFFALLSLPYGIVVSAALPHVAIKRSFQSAFEFDQWFPIFRKALGQFILGYIVIMVASFVFTFIMQVAAMTLILICIVPLLMVPYIVYQVLVMNAVYAQAYATGRDALQTT